MITPNWPAANNIKAITICRSDVNIDTNILPKKVLWLNQVHGTDSCNMDLQTDSFFDDLDTSYKEHQQNALSSYYRENLTQADASYATVKNIACAVKTADCLPILITNTAGTWISAIHAGWRGLLAGVISNTIKNYTHNNADLLAWIGPAICQEHFVVGSEVKELFETSHLIHASVAKKSSITNKWHIDLNAIAANMLTQLGIYNIFSGHYCTYCDKNLFYSYRRDGDKSGRLITLIWNAEI